MFLKFSQIYTFWCLTCPKSPTVSMYKFHKQRYGLYLNEGRIIVTKPVFADDVRIIGQIGYLKKNNVHPRCMRFLIGFFEVINCIVLNKLFLNIATLIITGFNSKNALKSFRSSYRKHKKLLSKQLLTGSHFHNIYAT